MYSVHDLLKAKHSIRELFIGWNIRLIGMRMMLVEKFHDVESTTIHIKVNVSFLKIWSDSFPYLDLGIHLLNFAPCGVAYAFAMCIWQNEQNFKFSTFAVYAHNQSANSTAVLHNSICLAVCQGFFYRFTGYNLPIFLKMVISESKFLQGTIVESRLIIENELLFIFRLKRE